MGNIQKLFLDEKSVIRVLILGPYGKCLLKLTELKNYLTTHGYENTRLVTDFPDIGQHQNDADVYFLEKSKEYIKNWAEVLLFVFDQECNNDSVLAEFFYTANSVTYKCDNSAIIASSQRYLGTLLRGTIKLNHIRLREFRTQEELNKKGYSVAFSITQEIHTKKWHITSNQL